MFVEMHDKLGNPLRVEATQIVIYNDSGTPIAVAGEYGPDRAQKVAHAADADFAATLRAFGVARHQVVASELRTTPLNGGARLVDGPGVTA